MEGKQVGKSRIDSAVIRRVIDGEITQREAASIMGVSNQAVNSHLMENYRILTGSNVSGRGKKYKFVRLLGGSPDTLTQTT